MTSAEVARRLRRIGIDYREARGSHRLYRIDECTTVVPMHTGDLSPKNRKGSGAMSRKEVADEMTFRVIFTKEGKDWTVVAPDTHPAHSWGPSLTSATEHIKEAIALVLGLPDGAEDSIKLDCEYRIDGMKPSESQIFKKARIARHKLHDAQQEADEMLRQAIEQGRQQGLSIRDIATMTDVSHQRVAQIASR